LIASSRELDDAVENERTSVEDLSVVFAAQMGRVDDQIFVQQNVDAVVASQQVEERLQAMTFRLRSHSPYHGDHHDDVHSSLDRNGVLKLWQRCQVAQCFGRVH
jgi:hypothetical protein